MKRLKLHWWILIGMALGILIGLLLGIFGFAKFVTNWIEPFGQIFVNLLKMMAVPIILVSIVKAITGLSDIKKLGKLGSKTVVTYVLTTIIAVSLGLVIANIAKPGKNMTAETRTMLVEKYESKIQQKVAGANEVKDSGPLQFLVDIVPSNIVGAMTNNKLMLQVIFFAFLFGISLLMVPKDVGAPVVKLFDGLFEVVIKMVLIAMKMAPLGVFALLAGLTASLAQQDLFSVKEVLTQLLIYSGAVLLGLGLMAYFIYPLLLNLFTKFSAFKFLKQISKAQLVAFSTSSSAATLPITMKIVEDDLGVSKEISSFVLPMGATVNMDGTSLFQAVSAIFIGYAFGMDMGIGTQLAIGLTCVLASIGAAAVPGAGTVMLVVVLGAAGYPVEGVALVFAVDRILDMCRTAVNVTGDAAISIFIAKGEGELNEVKN